MKPIHPILEGSRGAVVMGLQMDDYVLSVLSDGQKVTRLPLHKEKAQLYTQAPQLYRGLTDRWPFDGFNAFMEDPVAPTWSDTYSQVFHLVDYWTVLRDSRQKHLVATWVLATYFHRLFVTFPRLNFHGERHTGKSKALGTIALTAFNGLFQLNPTVATLFRLIDALRPTLCIDEVESLSGNDHKDMLSILNGGYLRGHRVPRLRQTGNGGWAMESFEVYCPIAFGGIKGLNTTLEDRAITIVTVRSRNMAAINRPQPSESEDFARARAGCYATYLLRFKDVAAAVFEPEPWLMGRRLELYGPLLTVATLASKDAFEAIYSLAREDVDQRSDISDDGAELVRCLLVCLFDRGAKAPLQEKLVYPQTIAEMMSNPDTREYIRPRDAGLLLSRYGFKPAKRQKKGQPYLVTREHVERLAEEYGISLTPEPEAAAPDNSDPFSEPVAS